MTANLLAPQTVSDNELCRAKLEQRKQRQAQYYNRGAVDMDPLRRGNVVLTNGHQSHLGASPNLFTKGCETDMGHGTAFHNTWVDIKKL